MFNFSKKVRKNNVVKLLFLFFLLLLASGFMPHVSAEEFSDNETMVVDTFSENNGVNSLSSSIIPNGNTFKDIQDAINAANDGDTIVLNQKEYFGSGNQISINKSINIQGDYNGGMPTLNADGLSRILLLQKCGINVKIDNCKFINGYEDYGAAIFILSSDITIDNCHFEYNEAKGGGAIYTQYPSGGYNGIGDNVKILNSHFYKNTAHLAAGAVGLYGNNSEIKNCIFEENIVNNKFNENENVIGGAIQIGMDNYYLVSSVVDCTFLKNRATSQVKEFTTHGGAGCVREGITFDGCRFIENSADQGGALTYHSAGKIIDCYFEGNVATSLYGGALSTGWNVGNMVLNIDNCEFRGNQAPNGGAAYLIGEDITINNCEFYDNSVTANGGAVYVESSTTTIKNSIVENNVANVNGGGMYLESDKTIIDNNQFIGNEAIPSQSKLNDGLGGAIFIEGSNADIKNNILNYNVARNGSAIYIGQPAKEIRITSNSMSNNQAWVYFLPITTSKNVIFTDEDVTLTATIYGGNNIAQVDNSEVSNGIYNAALPSKVFINGANPVNGANMDFLYQDSREYLVDVELKVVYEDGTVICDVKDTSNIEGEVSLYLSNLKPGKYTVYAIHEEDTYYKGITNVTTFNVVSKADLRVNKISPQSQYNYKDTIQWTLTVSNNGPDRATNVKVNDVLPEGLTWISDDSNGAYNPKTGIWEIGNLDVGESRTLNIISRADRTGDITNTAIVSGDEYDWDESNNEDDETVSVNPSADLEVIKTVNNSNPNYRDEVIWTVTVKNNGPDRATNVKVNDILPEGLVFISASGDGEFNQDTGIWEIGTIELGRSVSLKIVTLVNKTGDIVNYVNVSGEEYDINKENNKDDESIKVNDSADLEIIKEVNNPNPNYLEDVIWTITVKNNGPDKANGVYVEDILPEGIIWKSDNGNGSYNGERWNIGQLDAGESVKLIITAFVNSTGEFVNAAEVHGNEYDYNNTNNKDNSTIDVPPASDLQVIKEVDVKNPIYETNIKWTIKISNKGPNNATGVYVVDKLPEGLDFISSTDSNYDPVTGIWNIGDLKVGESKEIEIISKVNAVGEITNQVNITGNEFDYDLSNNYDSELIIARKVIDLDVNKYVNNTNPNYLDQIKWTITIINNGPNDASGVIVDEILPEGIIYIADNSGGSYNPVTGIWNIGELDEGELRSLDIVCYVNKTGHFVNVAIASGDEEDANETNNQDSADIDVKPAADLSITKNASKLEYNIGETIEFTVEIINNGPDSAENVTIHDIADSTLKILSYSADKGVFSEDGKTWTINSLNNGEKATLKFKAIGTALGSVFNRVSVSSNTFDYNLANNNASVMINLIEIVKKPTDEINAVKVTEPVFAAKVTTMGDVNMKATGNPITLIVLIILVLMPFLTRKIFMKK